MSEAASPRARQGRSSSPVSGVAGADSLADIASTVFPLIPLRDVVVFPQMVTPLFVSRPKSIAALEQALLRDDRLVVLVAQKDPECEDPHPEDIYQIGTLAEVMQMLKLPDGTVKV